MPVNQKILAAPEDKVQKAYNWIKSRNENFAVPFDQFKTDMQDPSKLEKAHRWISANNPAFKVPLEQFAQDMGTPVKKKVQTLPPDISGPVDQPPISSDFLNQPPPQLATPAAPPSPTSEAYSEQNDLEKMLEEAQKEHQQFVENGTIPEIPKVEAPNSDIHIGTPKIGLQQQAQKILSNDQAIQNAALTEKHINDIKFNDAVKNVKKESGGIKPDATISDTPERATPGELAVAKQQVEMEGEKQQRFLADLDNGVNPIAHGAGQFNQAIVDGLASIPKTIAILAHKADQTFGTEGLLGEAQNKQVQDYATYKAGQWIQDTAEALGVTKGNPKLYDNFWATAVPQGMGSVAAIVMGGFAGSGESLALQTLGKSSFLEATKITLGVLKHPSMVLGGTMMGVPEFEAAKKAGASDDAAFKTFLQNYVIGQTDALPIGRALERINKMTNSTMINVLKNGFQGGAEELIQETTQQFLTNIVAKDYYDKSRGLFDDVMSSGGAGFVVGFLLSAIGGGAKRLPKAEKEKVEQWVNSEKEKYAKNFGPEITNDLITPKSNEKSTTEPAQPTIVPEGQPPVEGQEQTGSGVGTEPVGQVPNSESSNAPEGKTEVGPVQGDGVLHEISPEEVKRQLTPFTDKMAEIEDHFKRKGYDISREYDNEIIVTDEDGEIVDPHELSKELQSLAGQYEEANQKLGETAGDHNVAQALTESRKNIIKEVSHEEVKKELSQSPVRDNGSDQIESNNVQSETDNEHDRRDNRGTEQTDLRNGDISLPVGTKSDGSTPKERATIAVDKLIESGDLERTKEGKIKVLTQKGGTELGKIVESLKQPANEIGNNPQETTSGERGKVPATGKQVESRERSDESSSVSRVNRKEKVREDKIQQPEPQKIVPKEDAFGQGGKFKVIGVNSEGNKVGEDQHGVRAVLEKNIISTQPVQMSPTKSGIHQAASKPEGEFLTTDEVKPVKKSDAKREHIKKLFGELDELIGPGRTNIVGDEDKNQKHKVAIKGAEIVGAYIDLGITRFHEIAKEVYQQHGEPALRKFIHALKAGYGHLLATADNIDELDDIKTIRNHTADDLIATFKKEENGNSTVPDTNGENTPELVTGKSTKESGAIAEGGQVERGVEQNSEQSPGRNRPTPEGGEERERSTRNSDLDDTGTGDTGRPTSEQQSETNGRLADVNAQNHVISDQDEIVPSGEAAKIKANIEAIKLAKTLEKENRNATPEEKKTLAKFVGWGGLASVLDERKFGNRSWEEAWNKKYGKFHEEIAGLLSKDELQAAVNSTINAHYTDRRVIKNIWDLAKHLGFKGGNVLEPSAGVGHFFGLMPQEMAKNSKLKAYELDKVSGQILSKLYPEAGVRVAGYETSLEGNNSQDLVISNVPFAQKAPFDKKNKDISKFSLHNYFIAKGIRQLKPGGLGIFITSMSSMDNPGASSKFRQWTNDEGNADFIGAIRLPNNAFEENAGTQVTTDILVYRKRTEDKPGDFNQQYRNAVPIQDTETQEGKPTTIDVNEYFANHPEMMLGKMALAYQVGSGGLYNADAQTLVAPAGQNTPKLIEERIKDFPKDIFGAESSEQEKETVASEQGDTEGSFKEKGGKVYLVENGNLVPQTWSGETISGEKGKKYTKAEVIKDYSAIKDAVRDLLKAEQGQNTDLEIKSLREQLNTVYDKFVRRYGTINNNRRTTFLEEDSESPMVYALENVKKDAILGDDDKIKRTFDITKSDIFSKRVNFPVQEPATADNLDDAVNISISYRNRIDLPYIAQMTGGTPEDVRQELLDSGIAFENPSTGLLEDADSYLSGFVRTKLHEAEAAAEDNKTYEKNVEELKKVVPKDIPANQIEFKLGSTWLPSESITSFLDKTLGVDANVRYNPTTGTWIINPQNTNDQRNRITFATKKFTALELIEKALNLRQPEVSYQVKGPDGSTTTVKDAEATAEAQAKQQELADMFYNFVKGDKPLMEQIEKLYNDTYNDFIEKKYSLPSFTHFPNASKDITLRVHQRKSVARMLQDSTLLAHQVGVGKTFSLITAAMEMRRLGIAKKPLIVVQNATLEQFAKDFKKLYPGANILAPNKKEMDSNNRQKLFNKIAYGDWDSIIIPQSFLDFIPDDEERERAYLKEQLDELNAALEEAPDRATKSELTRVIKGLEDRIDNIGVPKSKKVKDQAKENLAIEKALTRQAARRKDKVFTFENMGIDAMFLDEAHAYKKLGFLTKMSRIKGIDVGRSQRAFGAFMKARWIQEKNKGRNVVFATGTPITNTMAEVWTMMKYVAPDILQKYHINSFDEFATTFGQVEPSLEFTASGKFKIVERFKSYINAPELLTAFRSKTDVVLTEDIPEFKESNTIPKMKVQPDGKAGFTQKILPQTQGLQQMMQGFKQTLEKWEKLSGKEKRALSYIPLLVFNRAKQAAIDLRLIDPKAQDDPGSKTNAVVKEADRIYHETESYKGAQMIFSDMYQSPEAKDQYLDEEGTIPNPSYGQPRFNLYEDIKRKLVNRGIPEKEIAIIHDYEGEKRKILFEAINSGSVRIVLGSTERMGVGVNAQERLAALHHIDAPPRPMDFEQRNGRILRQGNMHASMNKPVEVLTYGVEKTLDATAYQRLAIKQKFINQMMKAEGVERTMADEADEDSASDMTFDQMMSTLSGSQYAVLHTQKMYELRKMRTAKLNHERNQVEYNSQIKHADRLIESLELTEKKYKPIQAEFKKLFPEYKVESVTIDGVKTNPTKETPLGPTLQKFIDKKYDEVNKNQNRLEIPASFKVNDDVIVSLKVFKTFSIKTGNYKNDLTYQINNKEHEGSIGGGNAIETGVGLVNSMNSTIENFIVDGDTQYTNINKIPEKIDKYKKDIVALQDLMDKPFEKADKLKGLESDVKDLEEKMKAENTDVQPPENTVQTESETPSGYEGEQYSTKKTYQPPLGSPKKSRKPTRLPVSPIYGADPKLLKTIVADLSKVIPQKIGYARPIGKRGAFGAYNPKSGSFNIRYQGDLDSVSHELGHGLDDVYDLVGKSSPAGEVELNKLSKFGSKGGNKLNEGMAEFVRAWLVNPDATETNYPETTKLFTDTVPVDMRAKIRAFGDDIRKFTGLTAHQQIMSNVQFEPEKQKGIYDRLFNNIRNKENFQLTWADRLGVNWTNAALPFEKSVEFLLDKQDIKDLPYSKDPRILARLLAGSNNKIQDILTNGFVDPSTPVSTTNGKDIKVNRIIDPVTKQPINFEFLIGALDSSSEASIKEEQKEVITYMIAQRTFELEKKLDRSDFVTGIGAGIFQDIEVAKKRLDEHNSMPQDKKERIEESARRYRLFAQTGLETAVAHGRLSQVSLDEINAANMQYIALNRIAEAGPDEEVIGFSKDGRALGAVKELVHKVKGSTKTIQNPYESLLTNTARTIKEADRNDALGAFEELFTAARVMHGGDPNFIGSVATQVPDKSAGNTITIFNKGQKHFWKLHPDVYSSVSGIVSDNKSLPGWATAVGRLLRWTVVNSPMFAVRNRIRDIGSRFVISDTKPHRGFDIHFNSELKKNNKEALALFGGGQSGYYMMDSELYQKQLNEAVRKLAEDKKNILANPKLLAEKAGDLYHNLISSGEMATRAEEYRSAFLFAKNKGMDDVNAATYAAFKSRDLLDFAVAGETTKKINQVIPFTNAAVQGVRKAYKSAKSDPAGFAIRWAIYSLLPALFSRMLAHWMDKDEEYENLPSYRRDLFYNLPVSPNLWLTIPKPFEIGVMGTGGDRLLSYYLYDQKNAFDGYAGSLARSFIPLDESALAGPFRSSIEVLANYDFFRKEHIIPTEEENEELQLRNTESASRLGQAISKAIGVDPRYVDFIAKANAGYFGDFALRLSDLGREDSRHPMDLSATGMFRHDPVYDSQDVQKLLDTIEKYKIPSSNLLIKMFHGQLALYFEETNPEIKASYGKSVRQSAIYYNEYFTDEAVTERIEGKSDNRKEKRK